MKPTYEELEAKCQLQKDKLEAINKLMVAIESAGDLAKDGIESLEQQLSESIRELRAAEATIHNLELNLTDMAAQLASADSKCAALATENAGMKAVCEDRRTFIMNGVQLGYIRVTTVETDSALETIRVAVSPQEPTPATDAFLAEVRAQGVEMAACALDDVNQFNYANMLDDLAQKLRQGCQHRRTGSRWHHH